MRKQILGCLLVLGLGIQGSKAAELTLVADGKPNAVIVVAAGTNAQQAAQEIQTYIEKMSGAKLTIVEDGQPVEGKPAVQILVGHTQAAKKLKVEIPSGFKEVVGDPMAFEEEGFLIKTVKDQIFLGGNDDGPYQGTIYAAYEFLERLGCRWYFPGEWGEVVPENKTVVFPETDLVTKPDFALRMVGLGGWIPCTTEERAIYNDWGRKVKYSRTNTGPTFYPLVGDGFLGYLLPPDEFMTNDPALYAMNKSGSREQPKKLNNVMLCWSNPEVFTESVSNLKKAFAGDRTSAIRRIVSHNGFGISPPDGVPYCYCDACRPLSHNFNYPTYAHKVQNSEEFFGFAARLAREFPDKWVATMAYAGREMPPQGVDIPNNLTVMYAPISTCVLHPFNDPSCWRRTETLSIMRQWTRLTPHVYLYDYNPGMLLGMFVPERDVANFAENARFYKDMKLKGFTPEGRKAFMQTWISSYVRGKLMWDVNADVEALKKDFYTTFFGPEAGPHVQQWWDECEKALAATTTHAHEDWLVNHIYTVPFTKRIGEHVQKARQSELTPKQKERVEAFAVIAEHLEAFAAMNAAEQKLDYAEAAKQAELMVALKTKLHEIYSFFIGPRKHVDFADGWAVRFTNLAARANGPTGTLVASLPSEAKFARDRFNEGVLAEWYLPAYDDKAWGTKDTFYTWDQQDEPEDAKGHDYDGYGWYRVTVNVPQGDVNKPLKLFLGGIINEGWVWINGQYAGHRRHDLWWAGRKRLEMEVDVTGKVKAGENVIAVRVWNDAEIGGWFRRGFLWAPVKTAAAPEEAKKK